MMDARRYLWLTLILLAWIMAACVGGSGSSGFDPLENLAIDEALDEKRCVDFEGLSVCPADSGTPPIEDSPTPSPTFTASPTPVFATEAPVTPSAAPADTRTPSVDVPTTTPPSQTRTPSPSGTPSDRTQAPTPVPPTVTQTPVLPPGLQTTLGGARDVQCDPVDGLCIFTFAFMPEGLPDTATYRLAQRTTLPLGSWQILPPPDEMGPVGAPSFANEVGVDPGDDSRLQLAVLVFLDPPPSLPPTVERLADTGADFAFVTDEVSVSP